MPEKRIILNTAARAKVFELYTKGLQQKEICQQLELSDKVVALHFIDFTATYHQTQISRKTQLKALEDKLFKELENNPNSNLCYQLEQRYCTFLLK